MQAEICTDDTMVFDFGAAWLIKSLLWLGLLESLFAVKMCYYDPFCM
jgi:hypothetical protein